MKSLFINKRNVSKTGDFNTDMNYKKVLTLKTLIAFYFLTNTKNQK